MIPTLLWRARASCSAAVATALHRVRAVQPRAFPAIGCAGALLADFLIAAELGAFVVFSYRLNAYQPVQPCTSPAPDRFACLTGAPAVAEESSSAWGTSSWKREGMLSPQKMQSRAAFAAPPAQVGPPRRGVSRARHATCVAAPYAAASGGGQAQHGQQHEQLRQQRIRQQQQHLTSSKAASGPPRAADSAAASPAHSAVEAGPSAAAAAKEAPAPAWELLRCEARTAAAEEPLLASFMFATVLNHRSLQAALAFHLANKLASPAIPATQLMRLFADVFAGEVLFDGGTGGEYLAEGKGRDERLAAKMDRYLRLDLLAVMERDPACNRFVDCLCYYKGFHALQAYRVSHELWLANKIALAYHLQSQVSKELQVDIHPAAVIGPGAFFDHATGVVIGETCTIGKNVSMLHQVTLGGSGSKHGVRHPQIGDGVLIGAGATLLGNIYVGNFAQIGAGSLVLEDVPENSTVVGVPARVVSRTDSNGVAGKVVPALDMKHDRCLGEEVHPCTKQDILAGQNSTARDNGINIDDGMSHPLRP